MKITKIELKDFHQFKDLTIDLTYPAGHAKEGQPLEKVCFIGQSGTGKTTLLKFLNAQAGTTGTIEALAKEVGAEKMKNVTFHSKIGDLRFQSNFEYNTPTKKILWPWVEAETLISGKRVNDKEGRKYFNDESDKIRIWTVFFPSDLNYSNVETVNDLLDEQEVDFRKLNVSGIWRVVLSEVEKFQAEELKKKQDIADLVVEAASMDTTKIKLALGEFEDWKNNSPNPIDKLADECLDKVLDPLNLRVSRAFKFDTKDDIGVVKIEDKNGSLVPYDLLSTGTKQIMLTAIPLYYLKPEQTVILCDEPERSLYPSMQRFIIDFYGGLTTDCQIFYATHSPIIASCFEPWEIVELKFNEEGYVEQDLYYPKDAERHVDSYTIIPSYLTYDLMLREVFEVDAHSHQRSEKITEVLTMRGELDKLKEDGKMKTAAAKKLYERYKDLAGKLFWDFETL